MKKYVFVIGAPKSGTTIFSETLSLYKNIFYLNEPNEIWGIARKELYNDEFVSTEIVESKKQKIKNSFIKYLDDNSKKILLEKTPNNCLRIDFINELFPNAYFIFISRKSEKVLHSLIECWQGDHTKIMGNRENKNKYTFYFKYLFARLRFKRRIKNLRSFKDWLFLFDKFTSFSSKALLKNSKTYWGPRIPLVYNMLKNEKIPLENICTQQLNYCIVKATSALKQLPPDRVMSVKYEDFLTAPHLTLQKVFSFVNESADIDYILSLAKLRNDIKSNHTRTQNSFPTEHHKIDEVIDLFHQQYRR